MDDVQNIRGVDDINKYRDTLELSEEYQSRYDVSSMSSLLSYVPNQTMKAKSDTDMDDYIAGIGKRIDDAYEQGVFTEDEYNQLNDELTKYAERALTANEGKRAWWGESASFGTYGGSPSMKEILDDLQKPVDDKSATYDKYAKYRTDRDMIWEMINKLRYGNSAEMITAMLK